MGEEFDGSKPTKYITHLDAINLYGWVIPHSLPVG